MRNPHGQAVWSGGDGPELEMDSITCAHCNTVVFVKLDLSNTGYCLKCMDNLCAACADRGNCVPFEKRLEAFEKGITKRLLCDRAADSYTRGR
jgi:hypothetical protein